ncbi:flippase [Haladaptatus caseinilyticus]|uniref:flippase n=1 Tax=Haladaptatus caseinilyticus TaxID=2993314 RepID=UPI00224B4D82|nr:flippase [Haladaptatus caseinilyticus]
MTLKDHIDTGLKMTFAARVVRIAANGLLMVLLTQFLLRPAEYGLLFLALAILGVFQLFCDLGLAKSAARYVTEFKETDPTQIPHILRTALKYRLLLFTIVGFIFLLVHTHIASFFDTPALTPFLLLGILYMGFHSFTAFSSVLFQGFDRVVWSASTQTVQHVCRVIFALILVLGFGLGGIGVLVGYIIAAALAAATAFFILYTRFYTAFEKAESPEPGLPRKILEYSIPLTATRSANVLTYKVDTLLIGFFLNPVAVGYYTLAKQISMTMLVPAGSLGFSISPTYGKQKANDQLEQAARLYETTLQHTLVLYVPAATGIILVAEPAVRLIFGQEYLGAVPVLQIFSAYIVLRALNSITTDALDYLGQARSRAIAKMATAIANCGLNVLLIPEFGVAGAAIATVATFSIYTLANLYIMHCEVSLSIGRLLQPISTISAVTVGMSIAVVIATQYISGIPSLTGVILLGMAVWGGLVTASGLLDIRTVVSAIS